jgi:hypothetical protein
MAFTGNGTKLIGDDGFLSTATPGAEIAGDGLTALPEGIYLITKVNSTTSGFPAPAGAGEAAAVGDVLVVKTGVTITPETDDDVITLTLTDDCDISSFQMDFTKDEVEVTTQCNSTKFFRAGKSDMSGTLEGSYTVGVTNKSDGKLREFIDLVEQDGGASFDRFVQQENIIIGFFYVNNDANLADEQYVVAAYQIYGQSLGGAIGEKQGFSSSFKFADKKVTTTNGDIDIKPTLYRLGDGS